jgi:hypothetical protein
VGELRKCLGFLVAKERLLVSSVNADGGEVARSPVSCTELETGMSLKKSVSGTGRGGGGDPCREGFGLRGGCSSRLKMLKGFSSMKALLVKIRMDMDRVLSRLGLRPKCPGFRLCMGCRFSRPSSGSRPKCGLDFGAFFRAFSGGCGPDRPPRACKLGSRLNVGIIVFSVGDNGSCSAGIWFSSTTSKTITVTSSDVGLTVVAIAEVLSTSLDVIAAPTSFPSITVEAETKAMVSRSPVVAVDESVAIDSVSPVVSVVSGLPEISVFLNSLPLEPLPHLVSDVGLKSLEVGDLGVLSGSSPVSLALIACDDPIPLRRWSNS